ncbi:MAG TPA: hypothetical protein VF582_08360, partial [Allosphingosinicella sp.]
MIELSPTALAVAGVVAGIWVALAAAATADARRRAQAARNVEGMAAKLTAIVGASPALPLLGE